MVVWLLTRPLPFYTSFFGMFFAIATVLLMRVKSRWGFVTGGIQTGSWLIVGPLTGQWWYMITGAILPAINWSAYRKWKREESRELLDQRSPSRP